MRKVNAILLSTFIIIFFPQTSLAAKKVFSAPSITSISPVTQQASAFNVVISGSNFQRVQSVNLYNASTGSLIGNPSYTVSSSTQITASVNLAAGSYFFTVITAWGTSNNSPTLTVTAPAPPPPPAPIITSISPTINTSGAFNVAITGSNFVGVQAVALYNASTGTAAGTANFTVNSSTQITASVNLAAGSYYFKVTSSAGTSNNSPTLTVTDPAPVTSGSNPAMQTGLSFTNDTAGVGTANFTVTLSQPTSATVTVEYVVLGGAADIALNPSSGAKLGSGIFTFQPGTTQQTLAIPRSYINEAILVTLANPVNAQFDQVPYYTTTYNGTASGTMTDDQKLLVSVMDPKFGAKGGGGTDDTTAIQKAVDLVSTNGGGVVIFPAGTYIVTKININENIAYQGLTGAILLRPPMQPAGTRTFTNQWRSYSGVADSRPLIIQGLTFDGNLLNQGAYQNYQLTSADLLFLTADPAKPGRLQAIVQGCTFKNGTYDGIAVWKNVNIKVNSCALQDIYRSGISMTGGYSIAYLKNVTTGGDIEPASIHTEVDGPGYGGSYQLNVTLEDVNCTRGRLELGFAAGSTLNATRVTVAPPPAGTLSTFQLYGSGAGTYNFNNCTISVGYPVSAGENCVYIPGTATFTGCTFISTETANQAPAGIYSFPILYWNYGSAFNNQSITFNGCTFTSDGTVASTIPKYGVRYTPTDPTQNNQLIFNNCVFTNQLDAAVGGLDGGGKLTFSNTTFNVACRNVGGSQKYPIFLTGHDGFYNWDVTINSCTFNTPYYMYIYGYSGTIPCTKNYLRQGNIQIGKSTNIVGTFDGIRNNNFLGLGSNPIMRVITGTGSPGSMSGFMSHDGTMFDQYIDLTVPTNPVYYRCVGMNPFVWMPYTP